MEAAGFAETFVLVYRHIFEDHHLEDY